MLWSKTKCGGCHCFSTCSSRTKHYINYCGSQRQRNQDLTAEALTQCLANRGLNYLKIKINSNFFPAGTVFTDPAIAA